MHLVLNHVPGELFISVKMGCFSLTRINAMAVKMCLVAPNVYQPVLMKPFNLMKRKVLLSYAPYVPTELILVLSLPVSKLVKVSV